MSDAYPALFLVPKSVEGDDGVYRMADTPNPDEVVSVITDALESNGWNRPADTILDARRGERTLQDEIPPAEPIESDGVTVVFSQTPAPEAEGHYDGPFEIAKMVVGQKFDVEVWIDAVIR